MKTQNLNKKNLRGYISSREINGAFYPQNVQNMVIRSCAGNFGYNLQLSGTEWKIKKSYLMLRSIIEEKNDGVIFFSIFQIYDTEEKNFNILINKIFKKKKIIIFALENLIIKKKKDLEKLGYILKINKITSSRSYYKNISKINLFKIN